MGMWDKDVKMAPDGYLTDFAPAPDLEKGERSVKGIKFALLGAKLVDPEWKTPTGTTPMCHLAVQKVDDKDKPTGDVLIVSALGTVIAGHVKEKEEGDLPALVQSGRVANKEAGFNDPFVINFLSKLDGKEYEIPERM